MKLINIRVPVDFNLFLTGDDHEGTKLRHHSGWEQFVHMVSSPYDGIPPQHNYVVDHGDIIEAITIDDPRYDGMTISEHSMLKQMESAYKHRLPIKSNIITILDGNHPRKLWRFGDITQEVCRQLDVPFGTWSARITYSDFYGNVLFKHFCTHGVGQALNSIADDPVRREANLKLALKKKLKFKAGDTALMSMGHTHKLLVCGPTKELFLNDSKGVIADDYTDASMFMSTGFIPPDLRWYVNTGSYYRLYGDDATSGYAEMAGYDPIELGFAVAKIRNGRIMEIEKVLI